MGKKEEIQQTHWEGCWEDPKHQACAVAKIDELRVMLATKIEKHDAAMERALREIRAQREETDRLNRLLAGSESEYEEMLTMRNRERQRAEVAEAALADERKNIDILEETLAQASCRARAEIASARQRAEAAEAALAELEATERGIAASVWAVDCLCAAFRPASADEMAAHNAVAVWLATRAQSAVQP